MASLEGWGSTIELHPQIKKLLYQGNYMKVTGLCPSTYADITPIFAVRNHA